jgi:hypothetical protein
MEQHRAKPSCNACHGVMDPLGFALENFDAIGEWRDRRSLRRHAHRRIRPARRRNGGEQPADLRVALMKRPEQFVETLTERLMTYALGRTVEYYDMPTCAASSTTLRAISTGSRRSSWVIVRSDPVPDAHGAEAVISTQ